MAVMTEAMKAHILKDVAELSIHGLTVNIESVRDGLVTVALYLTDVGGVQLLEIGRTTVKEGDTITALNIQKAMKFRMW